MSNLSLKHLVRKLRIKLSPGLLRDSPGLAPGAPGLEWGPTSPTLPQEPDEPGASPGPLQEIADVVNATTVANGDTRESCAASVLQMRPRTQTRKQMRRQS